MFKKLFRRYVRVIFHMKSGKDIIVRCRTIDIEHKGAEIQSYKMTGMKNSGEAFYIRIDDIEAITHN